MARSSCSADRSGDTVVYVRPSFRWDTFQDQASIVSRKMVKTACAGINITNKHNFNVSGNPTLGEEVATTTDAIGCEFLSPCADEFQNQNFIVNGKLVKLICAGIIITPTLVILTRERN